MNGPPTLSEPHLSDEAIFDFLESLPEPSREAFAHLQSCSLCSARAVLLLSPEPEEPATLDEVFERLEQGAAELEASHGREVAQAEALVGDFLVLTSARRREAVENDPKYQTLAFAHLLERKAEDLAGRDIESAQELLLLAIGVSEHLAGQGGSQVALSDLQARLYTELAETHRRAGSFDTADEALIQAARRLSVQPVPDSRARFCWVLARLRGDLGREDEALALYGRAWQLYKELRDTRRQSAVAYEMGRRHTIAGELQRARDAFRTAIAPEDAHTEVRVHALLAALIVGVNLGAGGRWEVEQERFLERLTEYWQVLTPLGRAVVRWLRGRFESRRGEGGHEDLDAAFQAFTEQGHIGLAFQSAADLARALSGRGDPEGRLPDLVARVRRLKEWTSVGQEFGEALEAFLTPLEQGTFDPQAAGRVLRLLDGQVPHEGLVVN